MKRGQSYVWRPFTDTSADVYTILSGTTCKSPLNSPVVETVNWICVVDEMVKSERTNERNVRYSWKFCLVT